MDIFEAFIMGYGLEAGLIVLLVGGLFYAFVQKGIGTAIALVGGLILVLHYMR